MTGLAHIKRSQLALLAEACAASKPLTLAVRTSGTEWQSQLCSLTTTELLVTSPNGAESGALPFGTPVEGRFSHGGSTWAFFATVQGRCGHSTLGALLRLSVPLMLQPGERRRSTRHLIDEQKVVSAQFTSVTDAGRAFPAYVVDLSDSGVGADVAGEHCKLLSVGDLFWIEVQPDGGGPCASFVVRVAHRERGRGGTTRFGFEFQAGDNREAFEKNLTRLEGMLRQCAVRGTDGGVAAMGTGVSKC